MRQPVFLPMSRQEMQALGWDELDVLLVTGDAYVDHPAFGAALIGRHLVSRGYRTGIVAQPNWRDAHSVTAMGRPRLYAGITAGAMDSMVANYTANKKLRRDDAYSPGGRYGLRPKRASIIYANLIRHAFPGLPVVLGGLEASMRRLAHYDYWENRVRRSLLLDAKADLLVYGMGERAAVEIAERLDQGKPLEGIPGTAITAAGLPADGPVEPLPAYDEVATSSEKLLESAVREEALRDSGAVLAQGHGRRFVLVFPPAPPLSTAEMDALYALPFARQAHPAYAEPVPALEPVRTSVTIHRGCFGGCSFCSLGAHQGKRIQSRSAEGILAEIRRMAASPQFRGTISDLGGPSANMYALRCRRPQGPCRRPSCLSPRICPHLETDHGALIRLLRRAASIPGVKHVFVASGIRYDLALADPRFVDALVGGHHVSGTLKTAPEHVDPDILRRMRKPDIAVFERFITAYRTASARHGQAGHLTAYFIASFPGSDAASAERIRAFARTRRIRIEPMQDFIPLPMTLAGAMHYAGRDPWTGKPLAIPVTPGERRAQRLALVGPPKKTLLPKKKRDPRPDRRRSRSNERGTAVQPRSK